MIYYTIYKTTNLVNGKTYIGKHKTKNLNDDYIGSGIYLMKAIKKYGRVNFQKEILFIFENESLMDDKEKEIVTAEFISSSLNYNAKLGGEGGFSKEESQKGINALLNRYSPEERSTRSKNNFHKTGLSKLSKDQISANGKKGAEIAKAMGKLGRNRPVWSEDEKLEQSKIMTDYYSKKLQETGRKMNYPKNRKKRETIIYPSVTCPHCGTEGKSNAMNRWHFNNCRNK